MSDLIFIFLLLLDLWSILTLVRNKLQLDLSLGLIIGIILLIFKIYLLVFILGVIGGLTQLNTTLLYGLSLVLQLFFAWKTAQQIFKLSLLNLKNFLQIHIFPKWYLTVLLLASITIILYILLVLIALVPADVDGLSYHLSFVGLAKQSGNILQVNSQFIWINSYPKSIEILQLFYAVVNPIGNIIEGIQLPFLFLGMVALYKLARFFGVNKRIAFIGGVSLLFTPLILNQLRTSYVDVVLFSLIFCFVVIAVYFPKINSQLALLCLSILAGFILGTKSTGIIILGFLLIFFCAHNFRYLKVLINNFTKQKKKKNKIIKYLIILTLPVLLIGLFWYLKVFIAYGNPIYPFKAYIFGYDLPGYLDPQVITSGYPEFIINKNFLERVVFYASEHLSWWGCLYNYDSNYAGFGPNWPILFIPALGFAVFFVTSKKRLPFLLLLISFIFLWLVYPSGWYGRYSLFMLFMGILAFVVILNKVPKLIKAILIIILFSNFLYVLFTSWFLCSVTPGLLADAIHKRSDYLAGSYHNYFDYVYSGGPYNIGLTSKNLILRGPLWGYEWQNKVYELTNESNDDLTLQLKAHDIDWYYLEKKNLAFEAKLDNYVLVYDDEDISVFQKK